MTKNIGTINWMAPELLDENGIITEKIDIYSYGMVVFEITSNLIPFYEFKLEQGAIVAIITGKRPIIPIEVDEALSNLIQACWKKNHLERPSIIQILAQLELRSFKSDVKSSHIFNYFAFGPDLFSYKWTKKGEDLRILEFDLTKSPSDFIFELEIEIFLSLLEKMNEIQSFNVSRFFAIKNRKIKKSFESKLTLMENIIETEISQFKIDTWKESFQDWRKWMLEKLDSFIQNFIYPFDNTMLKIIPLFYPLRDEATGWKMCEEGFVDFNQREFYFTNNLQYSIQSSYPNFQNENEQEYPILLCFVLLGNVYPCIEDPFSHDKLKTNIFQVYFKKWNTSLFITFISKTERLQFLFHDPQIERRKYSMFNY